MKNYLRLLILALTICVISSGAYAQKQKLGHIDSNELLKSMPGRDSAVAKIQDYAKELEKQLQGMNNELQAKIDDYQANVDKYTPLIKATKEKEIQEIQSRIESFQKSAEDDLKKKQDDLLQPIIDKAKAAIEKVAKANGYTYVFDSGLGVLLYTDPTDNLLPLVKTELGLK